MARLRDFQREDVEFIKRHGLRVLVASGMGTGKTPTAVVSILETGKWSLPALIACPASMTRQWKREFKTWAPGLRVHLIKDMGSPIEEDANVFITSWALLDPRSDQLRKIGIRTLVGDEAHFAKNPEALRSQALHLIAQQARGVLLLTGTPIINTKLEMEVLQALYGTTKPPMIRRLLEDVAPDIPPKSRSYIPVQLREKDRAEYQRAATDFESWLRREKERLLGEGLAESEVERAMAAEAFVRVGYLRRLIGRAKVPAAADWIARAARIGEPVVVFLEHQAALRKLSKALRKQRIRHAIIEGKTPPAQRQRYIDAFQDNKFPVLIGTKAAKEGITLHAARHLLFVERYFTSSDEEQAEDRIRRIGQRYPTTIWFLHAVDTIDERIDHIVRSKRRLIRTAIGSSDIRETNKKAVMNLISGWDAFVHTETQKPTKLGLGDPMEPLPSPGSTHSVIFDRPRWNLRAASTWCQMHGYLPTGYEVHEKRVKIIIHPAAVFTPNEFLSNHISRDIKAICGKRISKRNEAIVRRGLTRKGVPGHAVG
jgi:SNF2 family DNA or RNA helicase